MSRKFELKKNGFILISTPPEKAMLDVAESLGEVFKVSTMPLVQTLTPRLKENECDHTYSGNFGVNEFPFHTDLAHWYIPPRYLFLRCIRPAANVATRLIDRASLIHSSTDELLTRAQFMPRKRLDRKANLLKVWNGDIFRWDSMFIMPVNKTGKLLKEHIEHRLRSIQPNDLFLNNVGDGLLIDNWRMLHGRSAIDRESMDRKIERVYFNEVTI